MHVTHVDVARRVSASSPSSRKPQEAEEMLGKGNQSEAQFFSYRWAKGAAGVAHGASTTAAHAQRPNGAEMDGTNEYGTTVKREYDGTKAGRERDARFGEDERVRGSESGAPETGRGNP